jgi:hypothetical protein
LKTRLKSDHAIQASVALGLAVTAFADGGYSPRFIGAVGAVLWWAVFLGSALAVLPLVRMPRAGLIAAALLCLLAGFGALSMVWTSNGGEAFETAVRSATYAGLFVVVLTLSRRASARPWLIGILLGLSVVVLVALLTRFQPSLGADRELARLLPSSRGRLSYPIGYWNGLAACMALLAVLLCWLADAGRTRLTRALCAAGLPLPFLVIYLASSRGGVAASLVGLLVLVAFSHRRVRLLATLALAAPGTATLVLFASRQDELQKALNTSAATAQGHRLLAVTAGVVVVTGMLRLALNARIASLRVSRRAAIVAVAVLGAALVAGLVAVNPAQQWRGFKAPPAASARIHNDFIANHLISGSGSGRYQFWSAAVSGFESQPLRGIGAGAYESWWYRHGSLDYTLRNAHSLFLETLAELGLLGAGLLVGFFGLALVCGWRRRDRRYPGGNVAACMALLAAAIVSAAIDWTWQLPAAVAPAIVACALLCGPATLPGNRETRGGARGRLAWRPVALAFSLVAVVACSVLYLSASQLSASEAAARSGRLEEATIEAQGAALVEPWSSAPRLQLALLAERAGDLARARMEVDLAIARAPDDWRLWLVRTRLLLRSGEVDEAVRALDRARRLAPRSPLLVGPRAGKAGRGG